MRPARAILLAAAILLMTEGIPAQDRADVVVLRDGSTAEGLLFEQAPGNYLLLTSDTGLLVYINPSELVTVSHDAGQSLSVRYEDVVLLRSGLIFRGIIREEAPGRQIVLELGEEGGASAAGAATRLTLPYADIWKIIRRPVLAPDDPEASRTARSEAIALKLEITLGGGRTRRPGDGPESDAVRHLADDLAAAEEIRAQQEIAEGNRRREDDAAEVKSTAETLEEAIDELVSFAQTCDRRPTRTKGNGLEQNAATMLALLNQATGYEDWNTNDIAVHLRSHSGALATQAASPAGDPATLRALQDRFNARAEVSRIIGSGAGTNPIQLSRIQQTSATLLLSDRETLYAANRRHDELLGVGLNILPALNLGSWVQGDHAGALVNTAIMVSGGALIWAGFEYADSFAPIETDMGVMLLPADMTTVYLGTAVIGAAYLSSLIRPIWYDLRSNRLLATALNVRTQ